MDDIIVICEVLLNIRRFHLIFIWNMGSNIVKYYDFTASRLAVEEKSKYQ